MPDVTADWKVYEEGGKYVVHKLNADGSKGEAVKGGTHDTKEDAERHARALYANVKDVQADADGPEGNIEVPVPLEEAVIYASLPEIEWEDVDPGEEEDHVVEGAASEQRKVRAIRFKNWVVAKAERNKNGDLFSKRNMEEFAATAALMPITDRHPRKNSGDPVTFGTISSGRVITVTADDESVSGDYAIVDGTLWSGRHPELVRAMLEGNRRPSIEADSVRQGCTVCGQEFTSSAEYCHHLRAMRMQFPRPGDISRTHVNMKASGVAAVWLPAGTNTGFHDGQFTLVAEILDEENEMTEPTKKEDVTVDAATNDEANVLDAVDDVQAGDNSQLVALQAELDSKNSVIADIQRQVAVLQARLPELVSLGMDPVHAAELPVSTWDDKTYNAFVTTLKKNGAEKPNVTSGTNMTVVADAVDDTGNAPGITGMLSALTIYKPAQAGK